MPGYLKLIDYLDYLQPLADDNAGAWKLPNGEAYYAYKLRQETSTDMTPGANGLPDVQYQPKHQVGTSLTPGNTMFSGMNLPNLQKLFQTAPAQETPATAATATPETPVLLGEGENPGMSSDTTMLGSMGLGRTVGQEGATGLAAIAGGYIDPITGIAYFFY